MIRRWLVDWLSRAVVQESDPADLSAGMTVDELIGQKENGND